MNRRILCVVSLLVLVAAAAARAEIRNNTRTIAVSGDAEIKVTPDQVILTLGVSADDMVLAEAKRKSDEKCERLLATLDRLNIAKKDISSDYIKIEPRYELEHHKRILLGYFVDKNYVVTVRDISEFEVILSAVLESGAEYVHGIQFITTELREHRDLAREKALQAAREKADDMAAALDLEIGRAISIREERSSWYLPYNTWGRPRVSNYSQNALTPPGGGGDNDGTLEPGKISVNARVSVTFELK